jgi:imidazoleglycerol-phosphate dehydratase
MSRASRIERVTKESRVVVELDLDGSGATEVSTGVGFYDHMLDAFGRHALFDLSVRTEGDLHIDPHHTVEDTALALGSALREALGDRAGIRRFGSATVPLDEALARAVVDVSGRPYVEHTEPSGLAPMIGAYETSLTRHVWESLAANAALCLHVDVLRGRNAHHVAEAQFKAVARALREAVAIDPREPGVPSTKGTLTA